MSGGRLVLLLPLLPLLLAWEPVEVQAEGSRVFLHLVHADVEEVMVVGDERWERLRSGVVVRRDAQGELRGHLTDCRVTDLEDGMRFCADGRVLGPQGLVGRLEGWPTSAIPSRGRWIAIVSVAGELAIQRMGQEAVPLVTAEDNPPVQLRAHEGELFALWPHVVGRIDPGTGEVMPLLWPSFTARELVVVEGELYARGHRQRVDQGVWQRVPRTDGEIVAALGGSEALVQSCTLPGAPQLQPVRGELTGSWRQVRSTRWGLLAWGWHAWGEQLLGQAGWTNLPERGDWEVGPDRELYALDAQRGGVSVSRWSGSSLQEVAFLPRPPGRSLGLGSDEPFLGPDGRWWYLELADHQAHAFDGTAWVDLGDYLPVSYLTVESLDAEHLYAASERQLWRWSPAGFERVAEGVIARASPEGLLLWDGQRLIRGGQVLAKAPSLSVSRVLTDGCGRPWLVGEEVVVVEGGGVVQLEQPMLEPFGAWRHGDGTDQGVVLSDGVLVVEVHRPCER